MFTYSIPDDNPFAQTAGYRGEIWALGLRNPWGFSFDEHTGDLYIGDIGEGEFEEVNYQPASSQGGENYGWAICEGIRCNNPDGGSLTGFTQPVAEYQHSHRCAIVDDPIYRGPQFVSMYDIDLYADFCSGRIWGLRQIGDTWESALLYDAPFKISAIGEDEDGNLYVTNYTRGLIVALEGRIQAPWAAPTVTADPSD